MTSCSKNNCSNPLGRSIYVKFHHNVSEGHKKEVRNFGDSTILDKIRWDTLPYGREKAASSPFPLFNVAVMLSRTLTYMLTYNIDLGDGGGGGEREGGLTERCSYVVKNFDIHVDLQH